MNSDQMKAQGARCPCGGSDDYCVCQNVDLAALREQQKETAKDTYFAIAEYKTRIDWFEAKVAALTAAAEHQMHHTEVVRRNAEASEASAAELRALCLQAADIFDANDFGHDLRFKLRDAAIAAKVPG